MMRLGSNRWLVSGLAVALCVMLTGCIGIPGLPGDLGSMLDSAEGEELLEQLEEAGFEVDAGSLEELGPELREALWMIQGYAAALRQSVDDEWAGDRELIPAGG